jgi:hypothetical protein
MDLNDGFVLKNMALVYETMKTLETDSIHLRLHETGLVEILIKNGAIYDVNEMKQGKDFITAQLGEQKAYILLEVEGDVYTTREARELAASDEHSKHHGAIAICSDKLAVKILGNLYIRINKPKAPTKFFGQREEGIKWLRAQMQTK